MNAFEKEFPAESLGYQWKRSTLLLSLSQTFSSDLPLPILWILMKHWCVFQYFPPILNVHVCKGHQKEQYLILKST